MICSRGDALSRLPLAIIFRAFGASIREHISRLRRFDSRTHFAPSALQFANTFRAVGAPISKNRNQARRSTVSNHSKGETYEDCFCFPPDVHPVRTLRD